MTPLRRLSVLRGIYIAAAFLLMGSTWHLWLPHHERFPHTPFFGFLLNVPAAADVACLVVVLVSLIVASVRARHTESASFRWAIGTFLFALAASTLLDQQRFQPWVYHLALVWFVLLSVAKPSEPSQQSANARRAILLLQVLVVSIYLHSGLSKFDQAFADQHARYILSGFCDATGISASDWLDRRDPNWPDRRPLLFAMPIIELIASAGLCWRVTRKAAVLVAIGTHLFLIVALGPLGLQHEVGVLIWNALFIAQVIALFWPSPKTDAEPVDHRTIGTTATVVILLAASLPFARPTGYWDQWPSWAVYSPRRSELLVTVSETESDKLPSHVRPHVSQPDFNGRCLIRVDRWAIAELSAPMYPSMRIEHSAAIWLANRHGLNSIRVHVKNASPRQLILPDSGDFDFVFNAKPHE